MWPAEEVKNKQTTEGNWFEFCCIYITSWRHECLSIMLEQVRNVFCHFCKIVCPRFSSWYVTNLLEGIVLTNVILLHWKISEQAFQMGQSVEKPWDLWDLPQANPRPTASGLPSENPSGLQSSPRAQIHLAIPKAFTQIVILLYFPRVQCYPRA